FFLWSCNSAEKKSQAYQNSPEKQLSQDTKLKESMENGALVYEDFCTQCHMHDGMGVANSFPPLAGSNWLSEKRKESIHAVKYGQSGEIEVNGVRYNGVMAPMGLEDDEIADVMNYIMNSWGNVQTEMVTKEEVAAIKR
ncbi:MAG: cytochrome c, partial [Bacteroidota bacterium]